MMEPHPDDRPQVKEILNKYLPSDFELEQKFHKSIIKNLEAKISKLEQQLNIKKLERKYSL